MKISKLLIITILLFVIVNTTYFHEEYTGFFGFLFFCLIYFAILPFQLKNLIQLISNKFTDKSLIINFSFISLLLLIILYKPTGIINFEKFESKNEYIAAREGAANCNMTLKLKENKNYKLKSVCFGVLISEGKYQKKNDTIWFKPSITIHSEKDYNFGIIKSKSKFGSKGSIFLYKNKNDTLPLELWTQLNNLK
jgi:hypothetical protein